MKSLNYLKDHILYQISKIISIILKKHGEKTDNLSIRIYVKKIYEPKILKLLGSTSYIFKQFLIQNFHILKYGLLIKVLNHYRWKIK